MIFVGFFRISTEARKGNEGSGSFSSSNFWQVSLQTDASQRRKSEKLNLDTPVVDVEGESLDKSFAHFNGLTFACTTGVWCLPIARRIKMSDLNDSAVNDSAVSNYLELS